MNPLNNENLRNSNEFRRSPHHQSSNYIILRLLISLISLAIISVKLLIVKININDIWDTFYTLINKSEKKEAQPKKEHIRFDGELFI